MHLAAAKETNIVLLVSKAFLIFVCCLLAALFSLQTARAESHALLIGVSEYSNMPSRHLEGPENDVAALAETLRSKWKFKQRNIVSLVNYKATKKAILKELNRLKQTTKPNDHLLVYFSGHGTSSRDPRLRKLGLNPYTGALVPSDFQPGSDKQMLERLIVGQRDLRPVFESLDKNRNLLVVFDSCFSGYTCRSSRNQTLLVKRYFPLPAQTRGIEVVPVPTEPAPSVRPNSGPPPFPYNKLVYLAASSSWETAIDITQGAIDLGEVSTLDGKPHGAMTNTLLMALRGDSDTNRNGVITHRELFEYVKNRVAAKFPHTPKLLYNKSKAGRLDSAVFGQKVPVAAPPPPKADSLRVKLLTDALNLKARVARIKQVAITEKTPDLVLAKVGMGYQLYHVNGMALGPAAGLEPDDAIEIIELFSRAWGLIKPGYNKQAFNVFVDVPEADGMLTEGEWVSFKVIPEQKAYILILAMDSKGQINVIYPFDESELRPVEAGQTLLLEKLSRVTQPNFGMELIKVFAFKRQPYGMNQLFGAGIKPGSGIFNYLLGIMNQSKPDAQGFTMVKTAAKKDLTQQ